MKKVMDYICYRCIERELNGNVIAVSVPEIAEQLNYSQNFARNLARKLKEKELITSVCESGFDEYKDKYVVVRGYKPTEKGKQTDSYKKALYELTEQKGGDTLDNITNYDRIRNMSIDEFARFIEAVQTDALFLEGTIHDLEYPTEWEKWLEAEYEESGDL